MNRAACPLLLALSLLAGCRHVPPPPKTPLQYYAATYETERDTQVGVLPNVSDVLADDTPAALAKGRRVAFQPPDYCTTDSVTPSGAKQEKTSIVMHCGALLAQLEAAVAMAGYQVVSWQALKSTTNDSSLERARKLGVDVLFEVNQLTQEDRPAGQTNLTDLRFFAATRETRTPLAVSQDVSDRCAERVRAFSKKRPNEFLSTVNLKAVDVASGRALWLYQRSITEVQDAVDERSSNTLFYGAEGAHGPPPVPNNSLATGGVLLIVQGALLSLGVPITFATGGNWYSGQPFGVAQAPTFLGLGIGSAALGITMLIINKLLPVPSWGPATYPAPGSVLCASRYAVDDPWREDAPVRDDAPTTQYSYSYAAKQSAARDAAREREAKLKETTVATFVNALNIIASRAPPPAPTAQPPVEPPPPTPPLPFEPLPMPTPSPKTSPSKTSRSGR